ncbi:hypothetical protein D3C84_845670 [compost metagenome]
MKPGILKGWHGSTVTRHLRSAPEHCSVSAHLHTGLMANDDRLIGFSASCQAPFCKIDQACPDAHDQVTPERLRTTDPRSRCTRGRRLRPQGVALGERPVSETVPAQALAVFRSLAALLPTLCRQRRAPTTPRHTNPRGARALHHGGQEYDRRALQSVAGTLADATGSSAGLSLGRYFRAIGWIHPRPSPERHLFSLAASGQYHLHS